MSKDEVASGLPVRSFWVTGQGQSEIRSEPLKEPAEGEVLVRTLYSGISRGTEALVFNGRVPPSEFQRMRAPFQSGDFPGPVKYGYCNVGVVELGPGSLAGRFVFCLYPHQTLYVVPEDAVIPLPHDVPPSRAILAANLETAVNGLWDAAPAIGDRIAVVGAGTLGCLIAWLAARIPGCDIELIDIDTGKADIAARLGLQFRTPDAASGNADLVFHASASDAGLATALQVCGFEATVVEMSWFGDRRPRVPLGNEFHSRRLTLRSSQVGTVATAKRSRWTSRRRMELALHLLRDATLDVLISGESRFEELPEVMTKLASGSSGTFCHRIVY